MTESLEDNFASDDVPTSFGDSDDEHDAFTAPSSKKEKPAVKGQSGKTKAKGAQAPSKKRKAPEPSDDKEADSGPLDPEAEAKRLKKKQKFDAMKQKRREKAQAAPKPSVAKNRAFDETIQRASPDVQAELLWKQYLQACREQEIKLSNLETEDALTAAQFVAVPNREKPEAHAITALPKLVTKWGLSLKRPRPQGGAGTGAGAGARRKSGSGKQTGPAKGRLGQAMQAETKEEVEAAASGSPSAAPPVLLIISSSAVKAWDMGATLKPLGAGKFLELYARHHKVAEHVKILQESNLALAVGTPNRILKLCELGALNLNTVKYIIIDTAQDTKSRTIFTLADTRADFFELFHKFVLPAVRGSLTAGAEPGSVADTDAERTKLCLF